MFDLPMRVAVLALVSLVGCTTTYFTVDRVLGDVRRDETAAMTKLEDQTVGLQGRVRAKGRTTRAASAVATALDAFETEGGELGYLALEGTAGEPGQVLCLFEPALLNNLSTVHEGEMVIVMGEFDRAVGAPPDRIVVFRYCLVE